MLVPRVTVPRETGGQDEHDWINMRAAGHVMLDVIAVMRRITRCGSCDYERSDRNDNGGPHHRK